MKRRRRSDNPDKPKRKRNTEEDNATADIAEQVLDSVGQEEEEEYVTVTPEDLIPSGAMMLNCACSDNPFGAYGPGRIVTLPGSSSSGKTILALTSYNEMLHRPRFEDYRFIYDDAEEALAFNIPRLFPNAEGVPNLSTKLEPPGGYDKNGNPIHSNTIQDFKHHVLTLCSKSKKPFAYVLDSLDSLTSTQELEKEYKEALKAAESDEAVKELKGSYKTEKAKIIGETLRMINGELKKTESVLFIIQQIRQKIGVTFGKKTGTSGGNAPFFYSSHQVWLNRIKGIPKTLKGFKYKIGNEVKAEVVKNKLTGKVRNVSFNIYDDYGVDSVTSCVQFLKDAGFCKVEKQTIVMPELNIKGTIDTIARKIEERQLEHELAIIVGGVWNELEGQLRLRRKRNFTY